MGMAASQARLLCITARIHDVEYQAQSIQNAKTQLATLSDAAYREYLRELEDTTLTISTSADNRVVANFNTLCSRNRVRSADGKEYAIRDNNGKLLVEKEIAEGYKNFMTEAGRKDAYSFAMYMINGSSFNGYYTYDKEKPENEQHIQGEEAIQFAEEFVYKDIISRSENTSLQNKHDRILEIIQKAYDNSGSIEEFTNVNIYDPDAYVVTYGDTTLQKEYKEALASYKESLYKGYAGEIYAKANETILDENYDVEEDFNSELFNYFMSIYKQIETCGGCKSISDFNGFNGDAASNEEWLSAMIQSGQFSIEIVSKDKTTGLIDMQGTSPSSDISLSYTNTTEIDSKAMRIAEAKYEHELKKIDDQDKKYDLTLSKLDTERSALKTQIDSIKKVIDDNIERTFGIFS